MEINIPLLLKYTLKNGHAITVNIPISHSEPCFVLILGDNHEGSRREFLEFEDIYQILLINNIIAETAQSPSLVQTQLDLPREHKDWTRKTEIIENLIYDTLAKYIIQILLAANGTLYFPKLKFLQKHAMHFSKL